MQTKIRPIALYLPQYHPIPENDLWWGKGFTEWTNVAKAIPLFPGHYQPHVPADLGFYDLRCPETRHEQAEMARAHGIEGFCYWHYWFGGKRLLNRPFDEVLSSGKPDFPFCLSWANESWSGVWHGCPDQVLIEQTYPGREDYEKHFYTLLKAFQDDRYITVDGKPLLLIYRPMKLPDSNMVTDLWRDLAHQSGLKGLYIVGCLHSGRLWNPQKRGFDALTLANQVKIMEIPPKSGSDKFRRDLVGWLRTRKGQPVNIYNYEDALPYLVQNAPPDFELYPTVVPNWDNTPRSGKRGFVLHCSTPELWRKHLRDAIGAVKHLPLEHRLMFIKSWNEWAEGNHLEPDMKYGTAYLKVVREEVRLDHQSEVIVSVVMCTYNRVDWLADSIQSFFKQEHLGPNDFELLIIDNNSTDNTAATVRDLQEKHGKNIRYILEPEQGLSIARNRGILEARGEIIAFVDDDVFFDAQWLHNVIKTFAEDSTLAALGGRTLPHFDTGRPSWLSDELLVFYGSTNSGDKPKIMEFGENPFGVNMVFRRQVFDRIGLFSKELGRKGRVLLSGEEDELFYRLHMENMKVLYHPDAVIHHRIPAERTTRKWLLSRSYWQGITYITFKEGIRKSSKRTLLSGVKDDFLSIWRIVFLPGIISPRKVYWHLRNLRLEQRSRIRLKLGVIRQRLRMFFTMK